MRVKYTITDELKHDIKSAVVKERLIAVFMYINNILIKDISKLLNRHLDTVGRWINNFFQNCIENIKEKRGGDYKSFLTPTHKKKN